MKSITITGALLCCAAFASAQSISGCGQQAIAQDSTAIVADLSAMAAQAKAQGFPAAVEQFAADLETIVPTLSKPSQEAVERFVTDLVAATSATGPGGTTITPSERLKLTNDWTILVTSTGITSDQLATISDDLVSALNTLSGISTAQLQADLGVLRSDLAACQAAK